VEGIAANDDFFARGGHSLLAVRLVARIRDEFGVELPLRAVFEFPTLRAQAGAIVGAVASGVPDQPIPILRDRTRLPLSFAQERLWFLDQLEPGNTAYIMGGALRLRGPLDVSALAAAFDRVVERHEALRVVFRTEDGRPYAAAGPRPRLREVEAITDEQTRPFDLAEGPLLRASLARRGDEAVLAIAMHHIVSDGWSIDRLLEELCAGYGATTAAAPPPLTIQYADFAAWQRERAASGALDGHLTYWRERMRGAPTRLELPADRPRPDAQSYEASSHAAVIEAPLATLLAERGRELQTTPFMTLLAVFGAALHGWSGADDIVIGFPAAGRSRTELEPLIGMFVNTVPVRLQLQAGASFAQVAAHARTRTLEALANQDVPFEKLVDELRVERSLAWSPLFQVMLVMQEAKRPPVVPAGLSVEPLPAPPVTTTKFDLTLAVADHGSTMAITFEYDRALFDAATIERFSNDFLALLRRALEAPAEPLISNGPASLGAEARSAKAASGPTRGPAPFEAPASPVERAVAGIWCEVLRLDRVGATDNYFELGGDSILSIQVIARLRERGWRLTPKDIFRNQTLRALAAVATPVETGAAPVEDVASARLPVSPLQRLFLELAGEARHHFNQTLLLDIDPAIRADDLEAALREVQRVHPALRGRFAQEQGQWREHASPDVDLAIERFDCDTLTLEAECQRLQRGLNIEQGPVVRAAHFRIGQQARLFLVAHHLVVDAVSWRIVLDDLTRALGQRAAGRAPSLPAEHASAHAVRAAQLARHEPVTRERSPVFDGVAPDGGVSRPVVIERTSPRASAVAAEGLLAAFGRALCAVTQRPQVVVDVERHGRDEGELDLSRSVGWFTRIVPTRVAADDGLVIPLASASDGLSDVSFNFLGQGLSGGMDGVIRGLAAEPAGDPVAPGMPRRYRLDVNAVVTDGVLRLQLSFDAGMLPVHLVEEIAARTLAGVDEAHGLDVEAAYPLTPSQLGMWLQSVAQPDTPAFVEQAGFVMEGGVDVAVLKAALAEVIGRHAALRSAIAADGDGALRVVFRSVETPVREVEPQPGESEEVALTRLLDDDRRAGYRLDRPPLLRFMLLRVAPTRAWLVMSFHHVILDGWSLALFWAEAAACYEAARAGRAPSLPPPPDEQPLAEWLRMLEGNTAEAFWRERLAGFSAATPVVAPLPPPQFGEPAEHEHVMSADAGRAIAALRRETRVPPALVFEVLWSLLLAGRAGTDEVVFAATVSGRPPSVPGIERMLGCFINTVPVRVSVDRETSLRSLLARHHQDRVTQAEFEQCSAGQVHAWSQVPAGQPLAQTLLVYENLPGSGASGPAATTAPARRVQGAWTTYPLALLISPGATPHLRFVYQPGAIDADAVAELAGDFERLALAASAGSPVATLVSSVPPAIPAASAAAVPTAGPASYVAPRTLLEHQLAGIWEALFASGAIGVLDDFFSLGGHSLLAVQLAAQVRTTLHRDLPLQMLLLHPTIERLARAMEGATPSAGSLVRLTEGSDEPALVCPHPLGGHVLCYGPLARQLAGRTLWGLQAPGLAEGERPAASWHDLVDHHWRSLASVRTRPFALLGYSYGGYLTMELAARAMEDGSAPASVILLDVPHPSVIPPGTRHPDAATLLHAMFGRDLGIELDAMRAVSERELVRLVYDTALARHVLPDGTPIGQVERLLAVAAAHSRLAPPERRYEFPIVVLRAREGASRIADIDDYGWGDWCAGVEVEWVDGSHETMLDTVHVDGIARFLRKYVTGTAVSLARS
ncbi:MAG: condensation domain-containing protein, partial [Vicinamibacterales bacterium]